MQYRPAAQVLPPALLAQVQEYVDGAYLYIPRRPGHHRSWGDATRTRQELSVRNRQIYADYLAGDAPEVLAARYYLSEKHIQRILRQLRQDG